MVVAERTVQQQKHNSSAAAGARRRGRARNEDVTFYEVMYRNGRAKWYPESLLNVELYIYDSVDAYLQDNGNETLKSWAGPFQHGEPAKPSEAAEATDDFVAMWRTHYAL